MLLFFVGLGFLLVASMAGKQSNSPKTQDVAPTPTQTQQETTQTTRENTQAAWSTANTLLAATREGNYGTAAEKFKTGQGYWQTAGATQDTLQTLKERWTDRNTFTGSVATKDVQTAGNKAQVLIRHTQASVEQTTRIDLEKSGTDWKVTDISFTKPLDLSQSEKTKKQEAGTLENAAVSESPVTQVLPNGDTLQLGKTKFTALRKPGGAHEDIDVTVTSATRNYVIALYDMSRIVDYGYIIKDTPGTYFHAFDIRPLLETKGGLLLLYPETVRISIGELGRPPGAIEEIPVKINTSL